MWCVCFLVCLVFSGTLSVEGREGSGLEFDVLSWDFGDIAEEAGVVEGEFAYRNVCDIPIVIQRVQTTCGCTTPEYSKAPIMVGESGVLKVRFNPEGRTGRNIRDIYIYSTASVDPIVLRVTGRVEAREVPLEERYPYLLSDELRIESTHHSFRALPKGMTTQGYIGIVNTSSNGKSVNLELRNRAKNTLLQTSYEGEIEGGEQSLIGVSYRIDERSELRGRLQDTLDIYINGRRSQHSLAISGLIVE